MVRSVRNPGIGFEFIERAARVSQTASRNHRHHHSRSRCDRSGNQAGFVANPAGGMFVDFQSGDQGKVDHLARTNHGFRQRIDFAIGHAEKKMAINNAAI